MLLLLLLLLLLFFFFFLLLSLLLLLLLVVVVVVVVVVIKTIIIIIIIITITIIIIISLISPLMEVKHICLCPLRTRSFQHSTSIIVVLSSYTMFHYSDEIKRRFPILSQTNTPLIGSMYIYLHLQWKSTIHVGKYTVRPSAMDPIWPNYNISPTQADIAGDHPLLFTTIWGPKNPCEVAIIRPDPIGSWFAAFGKAPERPNIVVPTTCSRNAAPRPEGRKENK